MSEISRNRSFAGDATETVTTHDGRVGHRDLVAHLEVLRKELYVVREGVWCFVGNGLSNQTFIDAPDGIIAIDTGESNQEMDAALAALREHTQRPIVAVLYTHFHYVAGRSGREEGEGKSERESEREKVGAGCDDVARLTEEINR